MKKSLQEKDDMIRSFTDNNKSLKQQVEGLETKTNLMGDLQNECLALRGEKTEWEQSLQQKEVALEEVRKKKEELEDKVKGLESTIGGLEGDIRYRDTMVNQLQERLNTKDIELQKKGEECEALKSEKNDFEQQKQELEKVKREKGELENKIMDLNNEIPELQLRLQELTAKLAEMDQLKEQLERENEDLNDQFNDLKREKKRLSDELMCHIQHSSQQIEGLNGDLAFKQDRVQEMEGKNSNLERQLISSRDAHEAKEHDLKNQISELKEKLEKEKVQHKGELEVLRNQLATAEEEKNSLEEQITELQEQVRKLKANQENVKQLRELSQQGKKSLIDEKDELKGLNTSLTTERDGLQADLNCKNNEIERLEGIVCKKEETIKKLKEEKKQLGEELGERIKKLKEILDEKEKLLFEERRLVEQLQSERKKIPGLTKEVKKLQVALSSLEREKAQLEEAKKQLDKDLEKANRALAEQKSNLEQKVKELEEQLDFSVAEVSKLREEKEELERKNKRLQEEKEKADDAWLDLNRSHQRVVQEIGILKEENEALEEENEALKSANKAPQRKEPEPKQPNALDAVSMTSGASSNSSQLMVSGFLSRVLHWPEELLTAVNSLNSFLSRKNKALKGSFPELKEQHFCHTVVEKSVITLSNENDGRFESKILLEVLESDLNQTAREIIGNRVIEVVNAKDQKNNNIYYDSGKAINAALLNVTENYEVLKTELLSSIKKCIGELKFDVKDPGVIRDSALYTFNERKVGNSNLGALLKGIVVKELVDARMTHFSNKVQEVALNIRDKILSKRKICNKTPDKENTYQLSSEIVEKYKNPANLDKLNNPQL